MSRSVEHLYQQAAALSVDDRAELAGLLLENLDERRDPDAEEAWAREIERRMAEYQAGNVRTIPWQELRARLHRSDR